eukprot:CAMPEP_0170540914 /NCGR_PEP_ID=MMETSP0211-20121228/808_1 /TAXON_ID=311385 /ORGANISM="Pseudokeronopsis sp., Strain OXSARD2" /LENGTH=380 /DNA_ID=CAMNT_0010843471 /DNA_START=121 /DNA_END=1261 /DNA_ORIENTATION=-
MSDLGGGIDELDFQAFSGSPGGLSEETLSDDDGSLLGSNDSSLDHQEIVVDFSVVSEPSQRSDVLIIRVSLGAGIVLGASDGSRAHSVDLLVDLSSVEVSQLTSPGARPSDGSWMPSSDTTDLPQSSTSLSGESGDSHPLHNTLGSLTSGYPKSVDHLEVLEDFPNRNLGFELGESKVNLLSYGASIQLDLHKVSLLLSEVQLAQLGASKDSDILAVLLDPFEVSLDVVLALFIFLVLLGVLGEGLLLVRGVEILIEPSFELHGDVLSVHSGQSSEASGGFDVSDHSHNHHRGALDDGGGFNDIFLDELLSFSLLEISGDVGHSCLVAQEGSEVDGLGRVVSRVRSDPTSVVLGSALGNKLQGPVSGASYFLCDILSISD